MFVIPTLTGGFGARIFQTAAAIHYAHKHDRKVLFHEALMSENPYDDKMHICDIFPTISFVSDSELLRGATTLKDDNYPLRSSPSKVVILEGSFKNPFFFEDTIISISAPPALREMPEFDNYILLHIQRRSIPRLQYYYTACLKKISNTPILIVSDDIRWCKENIFTLFPFIDKARWKFMSDDLNDVETLWIMSQCRGGAICANSSLSWWGAYLGAHLNPQALCFMPAKWTFDGTKVDIWPRWAKVFLC